MYPGAGHANLLRYISGVRVYTDIRIVYFTPDV